MSSSNLVRLAVIEETTYGETPVAGNFATARFINESLSGTPDTVESQQIRVDRMSSGQIVVGLEVSGEMGFELAKDSTFDMFLESAMHNDWTTQAAVTVDLEIDVTNKELIRAAGDFTAASLAVGDILTLTGFVNAANNTQVMITEIVNATTLKIAGPATLVAEVGTGTTYKRADKLTIGIAKKSFSMEKKFLDMTNKAINYKGMIVSEMSLNFNYGELANGSLTFSGNDYQAVNAAVDMITNARTVDAAATSNTLNGSIDMPFLVTNASGTFDSSLAIQGITLGLNNNLSAQNVIGEIAPVNYSSGTAAIEVGLQVYNDDNSWALLQKKLNQDPFAIGFMVKNSGGYYGFFMPAVQVSGEDPSSAGANQDIILDLSGTAKVGATGESAIVIYKS